MSAARVVLLLIVAACGPEEPGGVDDSETGTTTASTPSTMGAPTTSDSAGGSATTNDTEGASATTGDACLEHRERCSCDQSLGPWHVTCELPALCPGDGTIDFILDDWDPHGDLPPGAVMVDELARGLLLATRAFLACRCGLVMNVGKQSLAG